MQCLWARMGVYMCVCLGCTCMCMGVGVLCAHVCGCICVWGCTCVRAPTCRSVPLAPCLEDDPQQEDCNGDSYPRVLYNSPQRSFLRKLGRQTHSKYGMRDHVQSPIKRRKDFNKVSLINNTWTNMMGLSSISWSARIQHLLLCVWEKCSTD